MSIYGYDSASITDVARLAYRVRMTFGTSPRARLASEIAVAGLMRAPWSLKALVWIARKRLKIAEIDAWEFVMKQSSEATDMFINQTADHILKGKDTTDSRSIGGFNQDETILMVEILARIDHRYARGEV